MHKNEQWWDGLVPVNSQEERMGMTVVAIFRNVTKNSTGVAPPTNMITDQPNMVSIINEAFYLCSTSFYPSPNLSVTLHLINSALQNCDNIPSF